MKKNEMNCIDSSRSSICTLCKPVAKYYKELEAVIAKLKALDYSDIEYEVEEECVQLNAQCVLDGEDEIYEPCVKDFINEYTNRYYRLSDEVTQLRNKLYRACGKCEGMNHLVKVILAEVEFVEARIALDIAEKTFDYLDENRFLAYFA